MVKKPARKQPARKRAPRDPSQRKARGLLTVGTSLPHLAAPALRKRGFAQAKLITDWPAIVGDAMARDTLPQDRIAEEMGDLLFVMANLARHLKVDPEVALRGANAKFSRRFAFIEAELARQGRSCDDSDLEEMDALWDRAKARGL